MKTYGVHSVETNKRDILSELMYNCTLMFEYLIDAGKSIPEWVGAKLITLEKKKSAEENKPEPLKEETQEIPNDENSYITDLTKVYKELSTLSLPATPKSLKDTVPTKKMFFFWGTLCIPFIRNLWMMSLVFLLGFIVSGSLNALYSNSEVYKQLFLLFSSGLGAYFYSLYTVRKYMVNRTFDSRYINHYYNRIVIGILAGFILANLVVKAFPDQTGAIANLTPSLIGLLGGYSADAVVKILNRFVSMLTTLVEGEVKDIIDTKEQEIKNKFELNRIKESSNLAVELQAISQLPALKNDSKIQDKIKELISGMLEIKNT